MKKRTRIADTKKVLCSTARPDGTGEQGPMETLRKKLESGAPMTEQELRSYAAFLAITGGRKRRQPKPGFVFINCFGKIMEIEQERAEAAGFTPLS